MKFITALTTTLFLIFIIIWLATYEAIYALNNNHPECIMARDTITCVKLAVKEQNK